MNRFTITESERGLIRKMHTNEMGRANLLKESMTLLSTIGESVVITDWLSPDNKYLILFDELYDLTTQKKIGDIWENFDNFKMFIKHSFEVAENVPQQIKESVFTSINSLVLTESMRDMSKIKPLLRKFINEEGFIDSISSGLKDTGEWAIDQTKEFGKTLADTAKGGVEGAKKLGASISSGDWSAVLDILGKGIVFVARKLRSLLYNPVGIVLDSILVATGIGKAAQWIPWAIVVALDIYELSSGDYEDKETPTWLRWIMIGTDVLGLVLSGGVAGSAKAALSVFKGAKTEAEFAQIAMKNPNTIKWIEKIVASFSKVPEYLGKAATYLKSTKLAKSAPWIENMLGKSEGFLSKGAESLNKITNTAKTAGVGGKELSSVAKSNKVAKGVGQTVKHAGKEGIKTAATVAGIDKAIKKGVQLYSGTSDADVQAAKTLAKTSKDYFDRYGISPADKLTAALQ